ncbi:hypothetical protein Tco_0083678, partial [Tanacetum coccineum]
WLLSRGDVRRQQQVVFGCGGGCMVAVMGGYRWYRYGDSDELAWWWRRGDGEGGYDDGDGVRVEPRWRRVVASGVDEGGVSMQWLEEGESDDDGGLNLAGFR